jgi:hypothetical protein
MTEGITGGYALFGKTCKTGDYENEKAEVRLDFNDATVLDRAGELAKEKVLDLLGLGVIKRSKSGRPPKVPEVTAAVVAEARKPAPAADPAAIDVIPTAKPVQAADAAAVEDFTAEAAPVATITDADLIAALNRKVAQTKNPIAIKQLIGTYVAPPKSAKEIPQEKRAEFLAAVEKL